MKYIFLLFFISFVSSSDMQKIYVYEDGIERHYLIYVPDAYNKDIKTNISLKSFLSFLKSIIVLSFNSKKFEKIIFSKLIVFLKSYSFNLYFS